MLLSICLFKSTKSKFKTCFQVCFRSLKLLDYMSHELPTLVFDSPDNAFVDEI